MLFLLSDDKQIDIPDEIVPKLGVTIVNMLGDTATTNSVVPISIISSTTMNKIVQLVSLENIVDQQDFVRKQDQLLELLCALNFLDNKELCHVVGACIASHLETLTSKEIAMFFNEEPFSDEMIQEIQHEKSLFSFVE
jgi:hypothetical protein